ncbi:aldo/keto reductase [Echinimonas agarilytica]|uniref:Aldo/keto reductase n=1 Tax=Echinimonas agarilytica TaxID=1215918 RepID=A0AA42B763_9GAMM|nr:aldo/keto reductase [Echinimonas agarilytica]MCM2679510.1 aldo/keto reductase [Echinimonas agarilytica]
MNYRILGKTGFKVSEIGLGCWQLGGDFGPVAEHTASDILAAASDAGINFWDTADVYGGGLSEQRIGDWTQKQLEQERVVVTKVGRDGALYPNQYSKAAVKANLEASAKRLQVEAIDLAQLHCVPKDVLMGGDLLAWMEDFQQQGLIRHFGASIETIEEGLFAIQHPKLASLQLIFNVFRQDAAERLLPEALKNNVGIIVRLPLASGLLSGKMTAQQTFDEGDHRRYNKDGAFFHVGETFNGIPFNTGVVLAEQLKSLIPSNMTLHQVALRWLLDQPAVSSVIAGASKVEQVKSNAAVSQLAPLSSDMHLLLTRFYQQSVRQHIRGGI